ncbi:unnamed protein product, partial [Coccothraustes coccothraustes]
MEGPGGEPPGTAAHRGSRGLREPPPSGLRCRRLPRPGSGTLRWGFAPGYGTSRRDFAVGFSRATGPSDGALRWRLAGLRDAPTGIRCGAQPGSATLRLDFEGLFSGVRDGAVLRSSVRLRDPPPGLCCGAQSGSGTLHRGSAAGLSRAPVLSSDGTLRCGSAGLRHGAPGQPPLSVGARLRSRAPLLRSGTLLRPPRLCARAGRAPPLPAAGSQWRGAGSALPAPSCLPWHLPRPHLPGLRAFSCLLLLLPPGHGALGAGAAPLPAPARDRRRRSRELNGTHRLLYGENEARTRLL